LRITSPQAKQVVGDGATGVLVTVTACSLNGDTGWLFDFDPADRTYTLDGTAPYMPIATGNGTFHFNNQPIGDPGDNGKTHTIVLVDASAPCAAVLAKATPDQNGDVRLTGLPGGCAEADRVDVLVTYPAA
jgi:hypothetical protein